MVSPGGWVELRLGVPATFRIIDWREVDRPITDATFGVAKTVRGLVLLVDTLSPPGSLANLSILSSRFRALLQPYLETGSYRDLTFTATKLGTGFLSEYRLEISATEPP